MLQSQGQFKLLALDMDGTLLDEEKQISGENEHWIQLAREAGVHVVISTGRSIITARPYIEQLQLETPIVTVNGSEIWRDSKTIHQRVIMDSKMVKELYRLIKNTDHHFWAVAVQGLFSRDQWVDDIESHDWLKFGVLIPELEERQRILSIVNEWNDILEITNSHPFNIEFNAKTVSKGNALEEVCRLLNIQMSEVIAMGDSGNDISMIRAAGLGVAMGNAEQHVKEIADLVTETNEANGIAKIIREVILR